MKQSDVAFSHSLQATSDKENKKEVFFKVSRNLQDVRGGDE